MTSLFQLEEQIDALNALNKSSAKALDALADTSSSITTRANAILKDVRPWEVAQENIARTIEQMSKAARCYHPPACLPAVLARKDANPDSVAQCIDYLVYTHDHMSSHPVNRYAASIKSNTARQVQEIVVVSEDLVKRTFISALQPSKEVLTLTQNNQRGREQKMQLIRNPKALESIDLVIQRLGDNFNRLDVLLHDVKELLANRMAESVNAQFGGAYDREANGDGEATRVRSSYQTGSHPLLRVSAMSRSMAGDVSRCVQRYIIAPLGENYQVIEMPGELAQSIFDLVMSRAMDAIQVDAKRLTDITKLFVELQGQGVEALGGARCFRDRVFLALDLIDELTKWKALAASLDGDNNQFIDYVDSVLETYLQSVRELLDTYASSRGELSASVLKSYSTTTQRFEWVPSADCSVHEYSTNLMYFQKVILSSYSSALKHVFSSRGAHGTHAELKAMEALEFFFVQCMEGSIADLETMGRCAVSLQREALARGKPLKSSASHISGGNSVITSAEVFVLNNLLFFSDTYQRESCFSTCVVPAAPASTSPPASITARSVKMIDSAKQRILAAFGKSWAACFTDVAADAQLQTIKKSSEPLSKAQTEAIKQWYSKASAAVATKIANSQGQKVSELLTRRLLADSARQVVTAQFGRMKELLNGREWSKQPQKYLSPSEAEITERIRKLF